MKLVHAGFKWAIEVNHMSGEFHKVKATNDMTEDVAEFMITGDELLGGLSDAIKTGIDEYIVHKDIRDHYEVSELSDRALEIIRLYIADDITQGEMYKRLDSLYMNPISVHYEDGEVWLGNGRINFKVDKRQVTQLIGDLQVLRDDMFNVKGDDQDEI